MKIKIGIRVKLLSGFAIVLLLFVGTILYSLQSIHSLEHNVQMTHDHPLTVTRAVIKIEVDIMAIHRSMKDIVLSVNGVENAKYISVVQQSEKNALEQFEIVLKQILGEEGQKLALGARKVFMDWRPIRDRVIALMEDGKYNEAQSITRTEGHVYVEIINDELKKLEEYAANKSMGLNKDSADIAIRTRNITLGALILCTVMSIFIALYLSISLTRRLKSISQAATKISQGELGITIIRKGKDEISQLADSFNKMAVQLKGMYESLELKVSDRTKDLEKANKELQTLKQSLEKTVIDRTKDLEKKVLELDRSEKAMLYMVEDMNLISEQLKTEQEKLDAANKELEAFSYSVSHDLRAPLRHIDGFAKLLHRNIKDKIDENSQKYFDNIISSSKQMSKLIDDLLMFSKTGRKDVKKVIINMKIIVHEAMKAFASDINKNNISMIVDEMPEVNMDSSLIMQVWDNLISNAIKFTGNNKNPEIHIGTDKDTDGNVFFFIKDNGVGFDQKYVDKIFGVFQRLHNINEFPGTGIGLANVMRIIIKHGGEIRAEGKINKGASFFFTLPKD